MGEKDMKKAFFILKITFCCLWAFANAGEICDLDAIYKKEYEYSLPRQTLESFLSGKAFDNKEGYLANEIEDLKGDIQRIFDQIIAENPALNKVAIMTAGAPGAGKTILMKQHREKGGNRYAYICPDDVCLKKMDSTYGQQVANNEKTKEMWLAAYNKWRPGSNAANHLILAHLIKQGYGLYFGTTSTAPQTALFFNFLKSKGYRICLLHITAPDKVRWQSIQERDKTFVQTTENDVKEKGLLFPQRIKDTYLKYADEIEFYYRGAFNEEAKLAAKWVRNSNDGVHLEVLSSTDYAKIKEIHNNMANSLGRGELLWEETVEKSIK